MGRKGLPREVAAHQEVDVLAGRIGKPETKERLLDLEIADLQNERDLARQPVSLLREIEFLRRKREILRALEVVEIGNAV